MGILASTLGLISDVSKAARSLGTVDEKHLAGGPGHAGEARFFERRADSISAAARKSMLLFPIVTSEMVSPAAAGMVAKAMQVRNAEYVRLVVTNFEVIQDVHGDAKGALISRFRGASLGDPILGESALINAMVAKDAMSLAEQASRPPSDGLRAPMERLHESETRTGEHVGTGAEGEPSEDGRMAQGPRPRHDAEWPTDSESEKAADEEQKSAPAGGGDGGGQRAVTPDGEGKDPKGKGDRPPSTANTADIAKWSSGATLEKVNRFMPILLDLTLRVQAPGETKAQDTKLMLGVKAVVHIIPSEDIVKALGASPQRDSLFLQALRLASGEISLVGDFILNLKVARDRTAPGSSAGKRVLEALRAQAEWNEHRAVWIYGQLSKRGFVPPTSTLVITGEEAARIRARFNVDFTKASVVRELLKSHNLMGFVIVEEALGFVRIFEDGDVDFDRVPFSELEARGKEASVKDIMAIMAKS